MQGASEEVFHLENDAEILESASEEVSHVDSDSAETFEPRNEEEIFRLVRDSETFHEEENVFAFDDFDEQSNLSDTEIQPTVSTYLDSAPAELSEYVEMNAEQQLSASTSSPKASIPVRDLLRLFHIKHKVPASQMEDLMNILRKNNSLPEFAEFPKTWRTVMRIDEDSENHRSNYTVQEWGTPEQSARYVYIGIEKRLNQYRNRYIPYGSRGEDDGPPHYEIVMNADGVKFGMKGVMKSLWPIQIMVWAVSPAGIGKERRVLVSGNPPHTIALHHSNKDPQDWIRFLTDFAIEVKKLDPKNDENPEDRSLTVTLVACICDGPAREHCKRIKGMLSRFPCEKCFCIGIKFGTNSMSNWFAQGHILRTDESFLVSTVHVRSEFNEETNKMEPVKSPLRMIGYFGMVTGFPLEPMHSVYHGACMNWLLKLFGNKRLTEKALSNSEKSLLDRRMDFAKHFTPAEFRSSRLKPFDHLSCWKAAETRHFLLYASIVLFKGIVPTSIYHRLCYLVVALYFIGGESPDPVPEEHLQHAQKLIERFFQEVARDHFRTALPPSLHWLLHVVNDCRFFGCHMERLGAWPFENSMRFMLNSVHAGHRAVEQILNREDEKLEFNLPTDDEGQILSDLTGGVQPFGAPDDKEKQPYFVTNIKKKRTLYFPKGSGDFLLKSTKNNQDCHFLYLTGPDLRNDVVIGKFLDVYRDAQTARLFIKGQQYLTKELLFTHPCKSDRFYGLKFKNLSTRIENFEVINVIGKMYAFPCMDNIETEDGNLDLANIEKLKLKKYLAAVIPRCAPRGPPAPNFREVCKGPFDAWEGMAIQHSYKTLP
jgi:hypothetical protein